MDEQKEAPALHNQCGILVRSESPSDAFANIAYEERQHIETANETISSLETP